MKAKILTLEELADESQRLRRQSKRLVATNGCFDLLHVGHVRYLHHARQLGDVLVVGVNADESVRKLKGQGRPINREQDRAEVLAALESVTHVVIFAEMRATSFLRAAAPAVYVKGGDYTPDSLDREERGVLAEIGARIDIIPFEPGYSTTTLLEKLLRR